MRSQLKAQRRPGGGGGGGRALGSGFRAQGSGLRVQGSGFRALGSEGLNTSECCFVFDCLMFQCIETYMNLLSEGYFLSQIYRFISKTLRIDY